MNLIVSLLKWLFTFNGRIGRWTYIPCALVLLFAPQLAALALCREAGGAANQLSFWIAAQTALGLLAGQSQTFLGFASLPALTMYAGLVAWLFLIWVSVSLGFRRAATAGVDRWVAALVPVPAVQLLAVGWLCIAPERPEERADPDPTGPSAPGRRSRAAILGALVGAAVSIAAVGVGALVFGQYGYAMFVASPFVMGAVAGFLANTEGDIGGKETFHVVIGSMVFASFGLIGFALEGVICLIMAFPLTVSAAWIGSLLGRRIALSQRPSAKSAFLSLALLPALFGVERAFPETVRFTQSETMVVAAGPAQTWTAILKMDQIPDQPSLPFRLGLAYPVRGEIIGTGVGAIRHGYFSTGMAVERITTWEPGRKLAFVILHDAPTLRELSPYEHVNAPHVEGYFRTSEAEFALEPLSGGRTRMTLSTHHQLDLQPAGYWMPVAQWAIHTNKVRVLNQIRRQAETRAP